VEKSFHDIADEQGWSETSMLIVALKFITDAGLGDALAAFAAEVAETENAGNEAD
jgi:hypothetical protein